MPDYTQNWTAFSEQREIDPFDTSRKALLRCGFRWTTSMPFVFEPGEIAPLEDNPLLAADGFEPEIHLEIDSESLESESGLKPSDTSVTILVRDRAIRDFIRIDTFPLPEDPTPFKVPGGLMESLCGSRGLVFGILVTPSGNLDSGEGLASRRSDVVASKFFTLDMPAESGGGFPVRFEDPEKFPEAFEGAVWYILWKDSEKLCDPDADVEDVLTVIYDRTCSEKLYRIPKSDDSGQLLWEELAVEIFLEIAAVVLKSEGVERPPESANGFLSKMVGTLESMTGESFETLQQLFQDASEIDTFSRLRARLHRFFELGDKIKKSKFSR